MRSKVGDEMARFYHGTVATVRGRQRTPSGRFREVDETGRSLKVDRRTKAKTTVKSGYGDRGDR